MNLKYAEHALRIDVRVLSCEGIRFPVLEPRVQGQVFVTGT